MSEPTQIDREYAIVMALVMDAGDLRRACVNVAARLTALERAVSLGLVNDDDEELTRLHKFAELLRAETLKGITQH